MWFGRCPGLGGVSCVLDEASRCSLGELNKKQIIFETETLSAVLAYISERKNFLYVDNEGKTRVQSFLWSRVPQRIWLLMCGRKSLQKLKHMYVLLVGFLVWLPAALQMNLHEVTISAWSNLVSKMCQWRLTSVGIFSWSCGIETETYLLRLYSSSNSVYLVVRNMSTQCATCTCESVSCWGAFDSRKSFMVAELWSIPAGWWAPRGAVGTGPNSNPSQLGQDPIPRVSKP